MVSHLYRLYLKQRLVYPDTTHRRLVVELHPVSANADEALY